MLHKCIPFEDQKWFPRPKSPRMSTARYDLRRSLDGTWTVIDVFTGMPVEYEARVQAGLSLDDAEVVVDIMNMLDLHRRRTRGIDKD